MGAADKRRSGAEEQGQSLTAVATPELQRRGGKKSNIPGLVSIRMTFF